MTQGKVERKREREEGFFLLFLSFLDIGRTFLDFTLSRSLFLSPVAPFSPSLLPSPHLLSYSLLFSVRGTARPSARDEDTRGGRTPSYINRWSSERPRC